MPTVRKREYCRQLSEFDRGQMVALRKAGVIFWKLVTGCPEVKARCCQARLLEERTQRVRETGQGRRTRERQDRHLILLAQEIASPQPDR